VRGGRASPRAKLRPLGIPVIADRAQQARSGGLRLAPGGVAEQIGGRPPLFSATKVWILTRVAGIGQMNLSAKLWGLPGFDLMQVHNMLDWEVHLPTLKEMKSQGRVRYIGVTTSHGRRHDLLEKIMRTEPIDFVQFTYNLNDRTAENRLLAVAAERRLAVVINRPFDGGELFGRKTAQPLPGWAKDLDCASWAEVFLKFIVSEPSVTCAIPATTKVDHVRENLRAMSGPMPASRDVHPMTAS